MGNALARKFRFLRLRGAMNDAEVADVLGTRPEIVSSWMKGGPSLERKRKRH